MPIRATCRPPPGGSRRTVSETHSVLSGCARNGSDLQLDLIAFYYRLTYKDHFAGVYHSLVYMIFNIRVGIGLVITKNNFNNFFLVFFKLFDKIE
jgi:hypothetical protein